MLRFATKTLLAASIATSLSAQCFDLNVGTNLGLTDDGVAAALPLGFTFNFGGVAYTDICVCSNGFIWLGPTSSGGDFSPSTAELLSNPPRICPLWIDLNPSSAGSGQVYYNTVPGFSATISWAGVHQFGSTTPFEMQMVLDVSGAIKVTYGANAPIGGSLGPSVICGASPGGGATANPVTFSVLPLNTVGDTFHEELLTPGPFPTFSNVQMVWTPNLPAAGYTVSVNPCVMNGFPAPASFDIVGTGCPAAFSPGLNAGDDTTHLVPLPFPFTHSNGTTYNNVYISSNGFFVFGTTNPGSGCCSGSNTTLVAGAPRIAGFWQDLNCSDTSATGNGDIVTYTDAGTGDFVIDWVNVGEFGDATPAANNFQVALSSTGDIKMRYGNVAITNATRVALCGFSVGGGAIDPGSTDLSAIGAPSTSTLYELFSNATPNPVDLSGSSFLLLNVGAGQYSVIPGAGGSYTFGPAPVSPLTLTNTGLPQVGGAPFSINVTNIAPTPNGNLCILLISSEIPGGAPLDGLGLTGCTAFANLPAVVSFLNLTLGAPSTSFGLSIPNNTAFYGVSLMTQAVSDDTTANTFGWRVSNGGRMNLGL